MVPLEIDQTGLEDYAVELRDGDGTSFECLHYQLVRSVLKPDDRVYIRALDKDDNRRRRLSGRHQISSEGKRLIDGLPWGRPLLKPPTSRPPIHVPAPKRRRLTYDQDGPGSHSELREDEEESRALLTNGEIFRDAEDSSSIRIALDFENADAEVKNYDEEVELADLVDASESDEYAEDDLEMEDDEEDIDQELRDLQQEEEENAAPREEGFAHIDKAQNVGHKIRDLDEGNEQDNSSSLSDEELSQEYRDQQEKNLTSAEGAKPSTFFSNVPALDLGDADKLSALQAAFPKTPVIVCEKILASSAGDLKMSYSQLAEGFPPSLSESELLAWPRLGGSASSTSKTSQVVIANKSTATKRLYEKPNEGGSSGEDWEEVPDFVRQFDRRGLPPGSITSGRGLAQMAAISGSFTNSKINRESEATFVTLKGSKVSPDKEADKADTTSSSGTSSSSEDEISGSDDESSEEDTTSDDSDFNSDDSISRRHSSESSGSSSDDSGEDSDSGPEESSTKRGTHNSSRSRAQGRGSTNPDSSSESGSNEDTFEAGDTSSCDDDSSEGESSEADSGSKSENEGAQVKLPPSGSLLPKPQAVQESLTKKQVPHTQSLVVPQSTSSLPKPVPPGAGKQETKNRNARRRAAKQASKLAQQSGLTGSFATSAAGDQPSAPTATNEKALFETKRQALLDAIAQGGVEIGPSSQVDQSGDASMTSTGAKRKYGELDITKGLGEQEETPREISVGQDAPSLVSAEKRRRIDLGASRRLVFGALGLRNPKSKEDEDRLRKNLMKDVQPLVNRHLRQEKDDANQPEGGSVQVAEDADAWREKINYRAMECCYEGVKLSEPPFPFVQRWDPQQQGSWFQKSKRGGQGKKAQRNQADYYQGNYAGKKRKQNVSVNLEVYSGYDDTFTGIEDETHDPNIRLNYDDAADDDAMNGPANETSQLTDLDDLPSLPSDLSTLPILHPGEAQIGMVITWQKWSCSTATNWQPQLSDVTGVVVRIDDDAPGLEVCLAKRDRYLDGNPKRYDENTGQRIYDRFEAPDLDEQGDTEDEEGYRTVGFAEMQQPRILQQPLPSDQLEGRQTNSHNEEKSQHDFREEEAQELSVPPWQTGDSESLPPVTAEQNTLIDTSTVGTEPVKESTDEPSKEVITDATSTSGPYQPGQDQQMTELSSLSLLSGISSPSRQLHQDTSQAIDAISQGPFAWEQFALRDNWDDDEANKIDSIIANSQDASANEPSGPAFSNGDEVIAGTPKVLNSIKTVRSSGSSARSGRQMDYTGLDMDVEEPGSLNTTDDDIHGDSASVILATGEQARGSQDDMPTPTPTPARQTNISVQRQEKTNSADSAATSPNPSTPDSLCSVNTVWCTAHTSHKTQSPSKSQPLSESTKRQQKSQARNDLEYEEAMRKLEDSSDDHDGSSKITDTFKRKSQISLNRIVEDEENIFIEESLPAQHTSTEAHISPPPFRKQRSSKPRSSQISIPYGSQVVELSSDSEPVYAENYADDEVDENYSPRSSSIPRGGGWVDKKVDSARHITRSSTAPLGSQPLKKRRLVSASQSQSLSPSTSSSSWSRALGKSRRKASAKF
ncbi:hypothetical protein F4779DRAFT_322392 [Xylariaceae sp. FL0662B]|nr:hypothetical protein F4779DRAFT_322392 [Xylariaceae sp. FL0662B]